MPFDPATKWVNPMDDPGLFNILRNATKVKDLMRRAGDLRGQLEQLKEDLARRTVEGESGAGAVRVVMNGQMQVVSVKLDKPLLATLADDGKETDQRMVEDLIAAAVNAAVANARQMVSAEMSRVTGGMDLPGLDGLLGG